MFVCFPVAVDAILLSDPILLCCVVDTTYKCTSYRPRIWQRILIDIVLYR